MILTNGLFERQAPSRTAKRRQKFQGDDFCSNWKKFVNDSFIGGFDSRKHPFFIGDAIKNFNFLDEKIAIGSTEVYKLAESIYSILSKKIINILDGKNL